MPDQSDSLILIDHDGTLCQTNPSAYDSINYAIENALRTIKLTPKFIDLDSIMTQLSGTTEKRLVQELISIYSIDLNKQSLFESSFYQSRTNWYKTMKSHNEFIFDTYYPDMEYLVKRIVDNPHFHLGLVTGNPSPVINIRLSPHIKDFFTQKKHLFGAFGEESTSRTELILKAITKSKSVFPGFIPIKNSNGFFKNIFYIGDSKHDFIAGLTARVKTIYIPSRSLQHTKSVKNEEYVQLIDNILGGELLVTNDCSSQTTLDFVGIL